MYKSIHNHISNSMDERSIDIINNVSKFNKQYIEFTNQILNLQNEILEFLPEDFKTLFYDYEVLIYERDSIKNLILYRQGISDGTKIRNILCCTRNICLGKEEF